MKRYLIMLSMVLCVAGGYAQKNNKQQPKQKATPVKEDELTGKKAKEDLAKFRDEVMKDFNAFRKQCWEEYSEYLRQVWKEFKGEEAVRVPEEKDTKPVVLPPLERMQPVMVIPESKPISFNKTITPAPPKAEAEPQPQPIEPVEEVPNEFGDEKYVEFTFYGTPIKVRFDVDEKVKLRGIDENSVADAMQSMTSEYYDNMLFDCLKLRDNLQLNDWAYLQLLKELAYNICGRRTNEAVVTMAKLYVESGYRMRLGSDGKQLYALFGSKHMIFDKPSFIVDGDSYYGVEELPKQLNISVAVYPNEQSLSLLMHKNLKFTVAPTKLREITAERYKDFKASVQVNQNLLNFYDTYPSSYLNGDLMTKWAMYANTPMQDEVVKQLYPVVREKLKGMSQLEAVEHLLNWVQTGLTYEYDNKVWGYDRSFFSEESLFYDYCDCEDRSILLTRMVRDLLGLECILIYYPGHLASAVAINDDAARGDYIQLNGKKFFIADGAYIGARVGMTMPKKDNSTAQVILLE